MTFSPSNLKFVPEFLGVRESREMRLKEFYAHVGYLRWAPNVTSEKMEITFFFYWGSNPGHLRDRPTLYHIAIKAGLYRKAVQVYHIPTPGDTWIYEDYNQKNACAQSDLTGKCRVCKYPKTGQVRVQFVGILRFLLKPSITK